MRSKYIFPGFVLVLILAACTDSRQPAGPGDSLVVQTLADGDAAGYHKALYPVEFSFPQDHGAHRDFRTEWWYFTGNVSTESGRSFGYQFTIFRSAVAADPPDTESAWATNQIYLAHTALSDIGSGEFYHDEQYAREALGLAGAHSNPFRAWVYGWSVSADDETGSAGFSVSIKVAAEKFTLHLELQPRKPPVLHGDRGLSAKSDTPGNASYYYSFTRMSTRGEIETGGERFAVSGESWFDHEWSTSALEADQAGWDWFSLQFTDNTELMLFRLRNSTDRTKDYYSGTFVREDGSTTALGAGDFVIQETGSWRSSLTGIRYPSGWEIQVPKLGMDIRIDPKMPNQEMNTGFRYWEGAVSVSALLEGERSGGHGYVELTGYR